MSMTVDGLELPAYYDPHYGCEMQGLRFDSDLPNPKYRKWIAELQRALEISPMVCNVSRPLNWAMPGRHVLSPAFPLSIAPEMAR